MSMIAPERSVESLRPPMPEEPAGVSATLTKAAALPTITASGEFGTPIDQTVGVPMDQLASLFEEEAPLQVIPEPEFMLEDLPASFRDAVDNNLDVARTLYLQRPELVGEYVDRHMLKKMAAIPEEPKAPALSVSGGAPGLSPETTGMTEANFRYWAEKDPQYLTRRMEERTILENSGPDGYATTKLTAREMARKDAMVVASVEAIMLGQYTDGLEGMVGRAGYDLRAGLGNVASFGIGGAEGVMRMLADFVGTGGVIGQEILGASQWLREEKLDAEAEMVGSAIDTGNPVLDYIRSAVFRGTPMMAAAVGVSLIPGVGPGGASAVMATGMASETYSTLRDEGIAPGLALAASAAAGTTSYFSTKFQLDNLGKYFRGKSPFGMFSVGTLKDVAGEAGQEILENVAQSGAEGIARLIGDPEYTARKFWNDQVSGFYQSIDEGASVGITTAAMRIIGLPVAARNQMRATAFSRASAKVGETIAKTEMFKEQPEALAGHLTGMAWQHGDGRVYTTLDTLAQAGVTREQAIRPVAEGGLGIAAAVYDEAGATGGTLAVGYGEAMVFGKKQAEAGNKAALGAFMAAPDTMSVGDIVRQRAEAEAIITQAEAYYQEEVKGDSSKTPLRIRLFKAGLRASGKFNTHQAAALTAMYRAGAERSAELAGETVEEWLARKNVRLEFSNALRGTGSREALYYAKLLEELDAPGESAAADSVAGVDETVSEPAGGGALEAAQADVEQSIAEVVDESAPDAGVLVQPVETAEENAAWEEEVVQNVVDSLADADVDKPAVAEAVKQAAEAARPLFEMDEVAPAAAPAAPAPVVTAEVAAAAPGAVDGGAETEVIFPAETKQPPLAARYALAEADSLQPSHTPRDFRPNDAWAGAALAQQRNYDSASMAPIRASIQGDKLNFASMFNPTTDAVNGPPIVTPDGMVLGGNNRTLRILNRYEQDDYRTTLEAHLSSRRNMFGIRPEAVQAMKRPVLVRVADAVTEADVPRLIGALNADFTTRRDAGNLAANRGLSVGVNTLNAFKGIGDQTVSAFLDDPDRAYRAVTAMRQDGVFQDTDLVGVYDFQNGKWLPGGKGQVEQALFGAVLPDSRLLDEMTPAMQRKLLKALPALIRLKASGSPELESLFQAVAWHNQYQDFKEDALGKQYKTEAARLEAFRKPEIPDLFTGELAPEKGGAAWDMLLEIQKAKSQKEVAEFFARKADELTGTGRGLFSLMQGAQKQALQKDIAQLYDAVFKNTADNSKFLNVGNVDQELAARILDATGIDVSGYRHVIDASGIRHTMKHHSSERERLRGQIPVGKDDFEIIPLVLSNPDTIAHVGKNDTGNDLVLFKKAVGDSVYVVEEVRVGRKALALQTMYKIGESGGAHTSETLLPRKQTPHATDSPETTIPGGDNNVNTDTQIIEEFYQEQRPENLSGNRGEIRLQQGAVNEKRAKFDAVPTLEITSDAIKAIPTGKEFADRLISWAGENGVFGTYSNGDTGWDDIIVNEQSVRDVNYHHARAGKLAVLQIVGDLIQNGVYLETTRRNSRMVSHIFAGKASIDGTPYTIAFSINEDRHGRRYYNHELTQIEKLPIRFWPRDSLRPTNANKSEGDSANREPISSIVRRHLFVNPDADANPPIIETLYQPENLSGNRGEIRFEPDRTVIALFKNADVSTVVHELNHLFLNDLVGLVKAGRGGERAQAHVAALDAFTDGGLMSDDPEKRQNAYEKIARAWEHYAMHGAAPAPALEDPFATIRKYMASVYRRAGENPLEEPSAAVRNVFDRMLATDKQIADAARIRELKGDWTKAGNASADVQQRMAEINARRDDRARKRQDASRGAGRAMRKESRLDATRRVIKGELSNEPAYRAIEIARAFGGMHRPGAVAAVGEAAVRKIEEKHGGGIFAANEAEGRSISEVAARAGYSFDTVADMLAAMGEAEGFDARAEREARAEMSAEELAEDAEREAQDEAEGVDDEAAVDAFSEWWLEGGEDAREAFDLDEQGMAEEVALAIANEYAEDGRLFNPPAREISVAMREWHNQRAAAKRAAEGKVFALSLREAADIRRFRSARNAAKRRAMEAALAGDRAKVTAAKKQEMYHFYEMQAAGKARALRQRIETEYSAGGLRTTINAVAPETAKLRDVIEKGYEGEQIRIAMNAAEHAAKVEYEYARSMAEVALWAGFGESRFLKELAGERTAEKTFIFPTESEELGGLVGNIAETVDPWLKNKERPAGFTGYRDFTVDQLVEIDRVMRWLIDNGRGKLAYLQEAEIQNLRDLTNKSIEPMLRRADRPSDIDHDGRTVRGSLRNRIGRFIIGITIPENWFMAMDGNPTIRGEAAGVNQRLLFETMRNADVEKDRLYGDVVGKMTPAFEAFNGMKKRLETQFGGRLFSVDGLPVPEILKRGRNISSWDADMLLSIAFQMGNDANLRRLLTDADFEARFGVKVTAEGALQDMTAPRYNFTNAQLNMIAELFTDAEWDAIQSVWDAMDSLYTQSDAVTFALTNRHVRKEPATAFTIRTADGTEKALRGGYFPLINDPRLSDRAGQLKEGQSIEEYVQTGSIAAVYGSTKQNAGAIKSRARNEANIPMSTLPQILDTNVLVRHVDAMAHYIAHALPLRDIDRLTRSAEWRDVYVAKFGSDRYAAIRKWIKNLAMPERGDTSAGGIFAERLRSLATVNALGLRWKTGVKQRLGAFNAAAYMGDAAGSYMTGWKYLSQGIGKMGVRGNLGFANAAFEEANRKSAYMLARDGGFDREMRAMQSRISPLSRELFGRTPKEWQNMMFFWIQANDRAMAYSVWWGAYLQAKAGDAGLGIAARDGESIDETDARIEAEAVAFADRAAATQASSFAADLTENQRDRGIMRFLSMFMSGNVRQGSRLMQYIDAYRLGDKTKADVVMTAAREFAFPAMAWVFTAAAVKYAMSEALGLGDDGDDDNLLAEAAWEVAHTAVAPFPLVREIPRAVQYGSLAGDVTAIKSAARAATQAFGIPERIADARYMLAVGDAMRAAGYAFGVPVMNPLDDFFGLRLSEALGLKKGRR